MRKSGRNKNCLTCGKDFYAPLWLQIRNGAKYCSHSCYAKSKIGKEPWNKGTKGLIKKNIGSFGHVSNKWRGTLEEYKSLHHWVGKQLGKPIKCSNCEKLGAGKMMHWANISGEYKKDTNDWIRLCARCHYKFDNTEKRRGI